VDAKGCGAGARRRQASCCRDYEHESVAVHDLPLRTCLSV
jgi:hypothetical protein